jgi:3-hydroxybutyryl-CoA dehydratase
VSQNEFDSGINADVAADAAETLGSGKVSEVLMKYESGLTYDELEIGMNASFSKTITETDVSLYAAISGDFNPMHVNEEYSKQARFGRRIAHGAVSQSLIASVLGTKLPGLGTVLVEITVRFRGPTFIGDTVTASAELVEKLEKKRRVRMKLVWTNQREETILEGEAIVIPPTLK